MATQEFLSGGGELGERIRQYDWTTTPLGPIDSWPQNLRTCVRIMLTSRQPIWIGWGKELIKLYNDPYKQIVAACGDGAAAGISAFNYIERLKGKPGIRSDWKKTIGDTIFHY